ncbi:YodC family protein [Pantoea ananatis]|uniref:YodC family protein n=1 Tax=Pantoea ananas TaxID=553 RepID=UPI000CF3DFEB|nr:DUF2158 domain-containing protein [Pantoea ananatis]PQL06077.1 hypothetical protein CG436_18590 [Pantoea ananatis]
MADQFEPGTVVQLKSGGPLMTIEKFATNKYCCEWFLEGELKSGFFSGTSLKEVKEDNSTL